MITRYSEMYDTNNTKNKNCLNACLSNSVPNFNRYITSLHKSNTKFPATLLMNIHMMHQYFYYYCTFYSLLTTVGWQMRWSTCAIYHNVLHDLTRWWHTHVCIVAVQEISKILYCSRSKRFTTDLHNVIVKQWFIVIVVARVTV